MPELAFVLFEAPIRPNPSDIAREAAALGLHLTPTPPSEDDDGEGLVGFDVRGGGALYVLSIAAPHPDARALPRGPLGAPAEVIESAKAHGIVTGVGLSGDRPSQELLVAIATAAVIRATGAVAAMLGEGLMFRSAGLFSDFAELAAREGVLPVELAVDVTHARESEERMSLLTHGMTRYGREELYLTCPIQGRGALDFLLSLARWLYLDREKHLPTGDTVGRSDRERVVVQRVASPTGEGPPVIRLDLAE